MKAENWNNDHPIYAPAHGVRVWIAFQANDSKTENCDVEIGFWDSCYKKWRFDGGTAVADLQKNVCGWLPIEKPTYDIKSC